MAQQIDLEQAIDLVEDLQPEEKKEIKEWMRKGKSIDILVTGKTGAGKSSLLNYVLGKTIFKEGDEKDTHCTSRVQCELSEKNGIKIRAWDSPGLQDGTDDDRYIQDLKLKCDKVDLMLYCISMEEVRSDLHTHESAIRKINDLNCWKNTVFVLTFANVIVLELQARGVPDTRIETEFKAQTEEWRNKIKIELTKLQVDKKIVDNIHVIPAGHPREADLPGCHYWLSSLWSHCLLSMKKSAQAAMIKMETRGPKGGFIQEKKASELAFAEVGADERKIVFTSGVKKAIAAAAGGTGAGGFAAGAAIGGTIGALAIGVPSFGSAAIGGLFIGAAVGGVIGAGLAIAVGASIAVYRMNKKNN